MVSLGLSYTNATKVITELTAELPVQLHNFDRSHFNLIQLPIEISKRKSTNHTGLYRHVLWLRIQGSAYP